MANGGIITQKQQQANEFIRGQLFKLRADEALPSIRKLMEMSGLGRVMLEKSLQYWQEKELLCAKPRLGYFRTAHENFRHNRRSISIIGCSCVNYLNIEAFQNHLIQHLFQLGSEQNFNMWVHSVRYEEPIGAYTELVREKEICNCFLISPENREIAKAVRAQGVNSVVIAPGYDLRFGPGVIDAPEMTEMQLDHLIAHGHKRIAYLYCDGEIYASHPHTIRREAYYRRMSHEGFRVHPNWVIPIWEEERKLRRDLDAMLDSPERPTAIICHEFYLPFIYAVLAEKHLVIGRDIDIMSDGEESRLRPKPTMVHNSSFDMAKLAWELMRNLIRGQIEERILAPEIRISEGRSVHRLYSC